MARPVPTPAPDDSPVDDLFHRAVDLSPADQEEFLRQHCTDPAVNRELRELLAADGRHTGGLLDSPTAAWARPPEQLGPYDVDRELGHGGMGTVYLGWQHQPVRRPVAIKILKAGLATDEGRARFTAERQALARMRHPGIATILDGGETRDGRPYLVMDLVEGVPLDEWLDRDPPLELRLRLFLDLCAAVQHAHQKGIVHRDIKPSNVLVEAGDRGPEPRVIDFGVARIHAAAAEEIDVLHTAPGAVVGTPGYMSPEQLEGSGDIDVRSDVYSLGVVLFELLTGERPFPAPTGPTAPARLLDRIRAGPPRRPSRSERGRNNPVDLDWIALRALEPEAERRYPTADALAADVRRVLRHEPITARPPSKWYLFHRFARRNRTAVTSGVLGVGALVLGLALALQQWRSAQHSDAAAQEHLADFRRLVDDKRLQDLLNEARTTLWPAWPRNIEAMDVWLKKARELVARGADLSVRAVAIRAEMSAAEDDAARREELAYQSEVLERLVAGIAELATDDPTPENIAGIVARRAQAVRTRQVSLETALPAWTDAMASINNDGECPAYGGLAFAPQVGLVPLGRNPSTQLWEFWQRWLAHDPIHAVTDHAETLRALRLFHLECGLADEFHLQWGLRRLVAKLRSLDVPFEHEEHAGGHRGLDERYPALLTKIARALA